MNTTYTSKAAVVTISQWINLDDFGTINSVMSHNMDDCSKWPRGPQSSFVYVLAK